MSERPRGFTILDHSPFKRDDDSKLQSLPTVFSKELLLRKFKIPERSLICFCFFEMTSDRCWSFELVPQLNLSLGIAEASCPVTARVDTLVALNTLTDATLAALFL